jgi:hypothetical protein
MNSSATTLDQTRPTLPVRLLNGCGALLDKSPIPRTPLRAVDVIETAKRRCGLDDFGGGDFFEGISRLLDSCQREAQLNLIGRIVLRADLIRILCSYNEIGRRIQASCDRKFVNRSSSSACPAAVPPCCTPCSRWIPITESRSRGKS